MDINELTAKRDAIMAELEAYNEEKAVKEEWYHRNSLVKDELNRLIDEAQNGAKPIEPITIAAVTAEVAAAKQASKKAMVEVVIKEEVIK